MVIRFSFYIIGITQFSVVGIILFIRIGLLYTLVLLGCRTVIFGYGATLGLLGCYDMIVLLNCQATI